MGSMIYLVLIFGVLYFLFIMPEQKKNKKIKQMMNDLKVGNVVFTRGGIHGTIVGINEDIVTIATGPDKVKIDVTRGGIGSVLETAPNEEAKEEAITAEDTEVIGTISLDKKNEENA